MYQPINAHKSEMAKINQSKYAIQPSWDLIQTYLDEFGLKMTQFERFFGIPFNTLTQVKAGTRVFPIYAWGFIYEKKKPRYGVGFVFESIKKQELKERIKTARKNKSRKSSTPKEVSVDSHSRLLDIK